MPLKVDAPTCGFPSTSSKYPKTSASDGGLSLIQAKVSYHQTNFLRENCMTFIQIIILAFILLGHRNVLALYFAPGFRYANAVGAFTAWEASKQYPEIHDFVKYLVNWVAGTKPDISLLLAVIVAFADLPVQQLSLSGFDLATLSFYWRLFPLIKKWIGTARLSRRTTLSC
ncbi:MAG: hypothetical protein IPK53_07425 [bacterium]|nr:hypothetical protein [bacterium]